MVSIDPLADAYVACNNRNHASLKEELKTVLVKDDSAVV